MASTNKKDDIPVGGEPSALTSWRGKFPSADGEERSSLRPGLSLVAWCPGWWQQWAGNGGGLLCSPKDSFLQHPVPGAATGAWCPRAPRACGAGENAAGGHGTLIPTHKGRRLPAAVWVYKELFCLFFLCIIHRCRYAELSFRIPRR